MIRSLSLVLLTLLCVASPSFGQETTPYVATTADKTDVDEEVLRLRLNPLTAAQLEVEADAWMAHLVALNTQISQNQILQLQTNDTNTLGPQLTSLREDRIRLLRNLNRVTRALNARGGDAKRFEQYIDASTTTGFSFSFVMDWIVSAGGGIRFGLNTLKFLLTLLAFKVLASVAGGIVRKAVNRLKNTTDLLRSFAVNVARRTVFLIGLIIALGQLEVDITPLIAALGAAGLVIGFALQGTLSNFASGLMILIYRPYDVGQVVTSAGVTGKVHAMTLVSTTLRLPDGQTVIIPNNSIWGNVITNVTGQKTRRVDMKFGTGYGDDLKKTQALLEEIITSHPKVHAEPAPIVKVHELGESSVNFIVRPWADTADYWDIFWDVTRAVKDRFDAEGIGIPFPQRDVHLHQVKD
tara:strand:+ start:616 stop:1845 length:1230 start_codon:yes stop_codon:yes gene_type:complete